MQKRKLIFGVTEYFAIEKKVRIKKMIPTSVVALIVSVILCPLAVIIACQYFKIVIVWYYVFSAFLAAFVVYVVATGGWEKASEIWNRTRYKKNK